MSDAVLDHRYVNAGDQHNRFVIGVVQPGDSYLVPPERITSA